MFSGIVIATGEIVAVNASNGDKRFRIKSDAMSFDKYREGESICVSGCCLTALNILADSFEADVSVETLSLTTFANAAAGTRVNLEPSLAVGDRLGGHFVTGHVDGVGQVESLQDDGRSVRLDIVVTPQIATLIARKGSVAVDGVSLTVNDVTSSGFSVNVIPHTAESTVFSTYRVGTQVNIEVDLLARYLQRLLSSGSGGPGKDD